MLLGGIETEGIFRRAGLESEMATLKTQIENGELVVSLKDFPKIASEETE